MSIDGFSLREKGPQAGLLWVTFANIVITGEKETPEYIEGCKRKAAIVEKVVRTELKLGTRHYDSSGQLLQTFEEILHSYARERGVYIDFPAERRWKLDELSKLYGIEKGGHDASAQDRADQDR